MKTFVANSVDGSTTSEFGKRNHRDLQLNINRLEYAKRSVYFLGFQSWNDILGKIREQE